MGFKTLKKINQYNKVTIGGIDVYLDAKVENKEEGITIFLEKIFFQRKIAVEGILIQLE
ncbi:MAG: hypothetical protein N4A64_12770 [Marinisporobacter sp.]|jgi:hypothetical protein|nr:hypothetical protein [Marinisporobacter sp.]